MPPEIGPNRDEITRSGRFRHRCAMGLKPGQHEGREGTSQEEPSIDRMGGWGVIGGNHELEGF